MSHSCYLAFIPGASLFEEAPLLRGLHFAEVYVLG